MGSCRPDPRPGAPLLVDTAYSRLPRPIIEHPYGCAPPGVRDDLRGYGVAVGEALAYASGRSDPCCELRLPSSRQMIRNRYSL